MKFVDYIPVFLLLFSYITCLFYLATFETKLDQLIEANAMITCMEEEPDTALKTCLAMFQGVNND